MAEDGIAVVKFQMLVEPDAGVGLSDDRCSVALRTSNGSRPYSARSGRKRTGKMISL
jgi:hypothetical protein